MSSLIKNGKDILIPGRPPQKTDPLREAHMIIAAVESARHKSLPETVDLLSKLNSNGWILVVDQKIGPGKCHVDIRQNMSRDTYNGLSVRHFTTLFLGELFKPAIDEILKARQPAPQPQSPPGEDNAAAAAQPQTDEERNDEKDHV